MAHTDKNYGADLNLKVLGQCLGLARGIFSTVVREILT